MAKKGKSLDASPYVAYDLAMWLRRIVAIVIGLFAIAGTAVGYPAYADSIRDNQWQLSFLGVEEAWKHATGRGQIVAVVDSGVDAHHPDLEGQVLPGIDLVDGSTDGRSDVVGHGTTVAALIAGSDDDQAGIVGVAPDARILPIRVLDPDNQYESARKVAQAIRWATDNGATVINASLGSAESSTVLADALQYAFEHDVVVVACNGNVSNKRGTEVWHPAREPGVIAVSGVTRDGSVWDGSLVGEATVLAAPAVDITSARPGGDYGLGQGTSFAAPTVTATVALVRSAFPRMDAANIINRLLHTAWDFGDPGLDPLYGYGVVNPTGALTERVATVRHNPLLPLESQDAGGIAADHEPSTRAHDSADANETSVDVVLLLLSGTAAVAAATALAVAAYAVRDVTRQKAANRTYAYSPPHEPQAPPERFRQPEPP